MSVLSRPYFHDEAAAFAKIEEILWPNGAVCPHCGCMGRVYKIKPNPEKRVRMGLHKCGDCRKQFTVRVGTIFEHSRIALHKWLQAIYLMCSSKKGISSHQLARTLEITVKSAWFLSHRIREAMRDGGLEKLGGEGMVVEVDETYVGGRKKGVGSGYQHKEPVLSLVERGGRVRSIHLPHVNARTLRPVINSQLDSETKVRTDKANWYHFVKNDFADHQAVDHGIGEYVRGDIHTNTIEGYFGILKRGIKGIYQHCSPKHLKRYLAEFDFRYNERGVSDVERAELAVMGVIGKRLEYKSTRISA